MAYDINTLDELIDALDGPSKAAEAMSEISPQAICNWKFKGYLPPSRHFQVLVLLKRLGKSVNPTLFDCTEMDWRLIGLLPGRDAGERNRVASKN